MGARATACMMYLQPSLRAGARGRVLAAVAWCAASSRPKRLYRWWWRGVGSGNAGDSSCAVLVVCGSCGDVDCAATMVCEARRRVARVRDVAACSEKPSRCRVISEAQVLDLRPEMAAGRDSMKARFSARYH